MIGGRGDSGDDENEVDDNVADDADDADDAADDDDDDEPFKWPLGFFIFLLRLCSHQTRILREEAKNKTEPDRTGRRRASGTPFRVV